jgi:hypothetical protein
MRFLADVIMGVIPSTSVRVAASGKDTGLSGFKRGEQDKHYDYFRDDNSNRTCKTYGDNRRRITPIATNHADQIYTSYIQFPINTNGAQ